MKFFFDNNVNRVLFCFLKCGYLKRILCFSFVRFFFFFGDFNSVDWFFVKFFFYKFAFFFLNSYFDFFYLTKLISNFFQCSDFFFIKFFFLLKKKGSLGVVFNRFFFIDSFVPVVFLKSFENVQLTFLFYFIKFYLQNRVKFKLSIFVCFVFDRIFFIKDFLLYSRLLQSISIFYTFSFLNLTFFLNKNLFCFYFYFSFIFLFLLKFILGLFNFYFFMKFC